MVWLSYNCGGTERIPTEEKLNSSSITSLVFKNAPVQMMSIDDPTNMTLTVYTVAISSSTVKNSQNGVRIKTVYNAIGTVKGVTDKDIVLEDITKHGIVIEQDYKTSNFAAYSCERRIFCRVWMFLERSPKTRLLQASQSAI
jgi:hypothetical protein